MKTILKISAGLLLLVINCFAYAACNSTGCSGVYVETLYINASGIIYIGTSGDETLMSCSAVSDVYVTLKRSEPAADMIFSTLLAAQMADKKVHIRTVDKSVGCKIAYVTLDKQ